MAVTKEDVILAKFKHSTRPHDAPLNSVQLRALFGKPKPKKSPLNINDIAKDFTEVYYTCNGMHKRYEW